jgi:hypothetical protein
MVIDTGQQKRSAIELPAAASQQVHGRNRRRRPGKRRHLHGTRGEGEHDEADNCAKRRAAGDPEHIRVSQRIPQQRLKSGAGG